MAVGGLTRPTKALERGDSVPPPRPPQSDRLPWTATASPRGDGLRRIVGRAGAGLKGGGEILIDF